MKTFIGNGKGTAQTAVEEATKGLTNPSMIIFIAPYIQAAETAKLIAEKFPDIPSIGTIGTKLANGTVGDDNLVVLGLFEDIETRCGLIPNLTQGPIASVRKIEQNISQTAPGREDTVCIEFCTGTEENLVTTLHACLEKRQIPLAGGTVFGIPDGKNAFVCYNGAIYENACVYALIKNKTGRIKVFKENIYKKNSTVSHFATKVDVNNRSLIELDGKPAIEVYCKELGISKDKVIDNVFQNPIGRVVGTQVFISSMKELGKNNEIINYKRINKNDCIYFLELGDYKATENETRQTIKDEMKHISLVFSIDCIYRYLMYQNKGYFNTYIHDMAALGNHIGIIGGGEQFNNQHVNQTMVCAVFE